MLLILSARLVYRVNIVVAAEVARDRTSCQLVERLTTQVLATLKEVLQCIQVVLQVPKLVSFRLTDVLVKVGVNGREGKG